MDRILSGIRVLDFTDAMAGPYCTTQLANCGCEVINLERPGGKVIRSVPPFHEGQSIDFMYNHCGKKSVAVNLKAEGARELVLKLARASDVVVENFRPGVMASMGLDYASIKEANPSIVMCSISAWGQTGPYAELMGVDVITQAQSGIVYMSSEPGKRPCFTSFAVTDIIAGITAFGAICAALYRRGVSGEGEYIDIAMYECTLAAIYNAVGTHILSKGKRDYRYMIGSFSADFSPCGVFQGKDGYLAIFARTDTAWEQLTEIMGKPELASDPRFKTLGDRVKRNKEVTAIVEEWLQGFERVSDAAHLLQSQRMMAGPVLSPGQVVDEDPQWQARDMLKEIEVPEIGPVKFLNTPLRFQNSRAYVNGPPPMAVGEHGYQILRDLLGLSDENIESLINSGVVCRAEAM